MVKNDMCRAEAPTVAVGRQPRDSYHRWQGHPTD